MKVPNLIILGTPKTGTTFLWKVLHEHPKIFMSKVKETHYFGGSNIRSYPNTSLNDYLNNFIGSEGSEYVGEASPWYFYSENACENLHTYNKDVKLIIILRNPIDFHLAHHNQMVNIGHENITNPLECIKKEGLRKEGKYIPEGAHTPDRLFYKELLNYPKYIRRYIKKFGENNIFIYKYDDLQDNPQAFLSEMLTDLKLEPFKFSNVSKVNERFKIKYGTLDHIVKITSKLIKKNTYTRKLIPRGVGKLMINLNKARTERKDDDPFIRNELRRFVPFKKRDLECLSGLKLTDWDIE